MIIKIVIITVMITIIKLNLCLYFALHISAMSTPRTSDAISVLVHSLIIYI